MQTRKVASKQVAFKVRVSLGSSLDPAGNLPVEIEVRRRKYLNQS
jgi:hypothetical protein